MITLHEPSWCAMCANQKNEPNLIFVRTNQQYCLNKLASISVTECQWIIKTFHVVNSKDKHI